MAKTFLPMMLASQTRPEYLDSFGEVLTSLQGRGRWCLAGLAESVWSGDTGLLPHIHQTLESMPRREVFGDSPRRADIYFHAYMIGYDEKHAHPTVVVLNPEREVLRNVKRIIFHNLKEASLYYSFQINGYAKYLRNILD